jgi:CheY-like chemotaxis protein
VSSIAILAGPEIGRLLAYRLLNTVHTRIPMSLRGLRILVIEDAQDIREVFTLLLRAEGADVLSAANGREATDLVAQQPFDVVLSDLGLPDIPGDVLIRELRSRSGRTIRVLVVTGYGEPFLSRARQAGADAVFTKPVEWSRILEYLERPDLAASA